MGEGESTLDNVSANKWVSSKNIVTYTKMQMVGCWECSWTREIRKLLCEGIIYLSYMNGEHANAWLLPMWVILVNHLQQPFDLRVWSQSYQKALDKWWGFRSLAILLWKCSPLLSLLFCGDLAEMGDS